MKKNKNSYNSSKSFSFITYFYCFPSVLFLFYIWCCFVVYILFSLVILVYTFKIQILFVFFKLTVFDFDESIASYVNPL